MQTLLNFCLCHTCSCLIGQSKSHGQDWSYCERYYPRLWMQKHIESHYCNSLLKNINLTSFLLISVFTKMIIILLSLPIVQGCKRINMQKKLLYIIQRKGTLQTLILCQFLHLPFLYLLYNMNNLSTY